MVYKCSYCGRRFNILKLEQNDIAICPFCGHVDFVKFTRMANNEIQKNEIHEDDEE